MIKSIVLASLLTFLILSSSTIICNKQEYRKSNGEQIVNNLLAKTTEIIKNKYNIKPSGMGVSMPGGPIQEVTLCFDTKSPYTQEQLRELLIKSSAELLHQVNESKEIQEFLKEKPFTIKNVEIIIYNHDENGFSLKDPQISVANISQGILNYSTNDPEDSFKYKNEYEESYEEAIKSLQSGPNPFIQNSVHVINGEQLVNRTLAITAKTIGEKYQVKPCGAGAAMPGGPIQELTLCFSTKSPYTREQLRELLVKSAQELLKQVNENGEIQEFLKERPFNLKNVQIIIYNSDKDGSEVYDPIISTADISEGILTYRTVDRSDTFTYKNEYEESYEEAIKSLPRS